MMLDKMNEKYIILKTDGVIVPTMDNMGAFFSNSPQFHIEPDRISVETAELTSKEQRDVRRDPSVRAIAQSMPMTLIEPVEKSSAIENYDSDVWGIEAIGATDCPFNGEGINVAVIDTGIDRNHEAFSGMDIVQANYTTEADDDIHGHGTHCAGSIFGRPVNGTRIGVAPGVNKAIIAKVLGKGGNSSMQVADAIRWALNEGAHVISMSLGMDFPKLVNDLVEYYGNDFIRPATSIALERYRQNVNLFSQLANLVNAQGAFGDGALIVAAAGNESNRPKYEIAAAPPSASNGIISVGALEKIDGRYSSANFSNNQVDISAPGVNIISAALGGGLVSMSGTSMATPYVAGVSALWAQRQRIRTSQIESSTLRARLIASGSYTKMVQGFEEEDVGTGIVQAPKQ